jgi:hypothetical protein
MRDGNLIWAAGDAARKQLSGRLVFLQIFLWHVVFRKLSRCHFGTIGEGRVFDSAHHRSFVILAFFKKFFYAFRTSVFRIGQALDIPGLAGGTWPDISRTRLFGFGIHILRCRSYFHALIFAQSPLALV